MAQHQNIPTPWHNLTPNYPNGKDILPKQFSYDALDVLGTIAIDITLDTIPVGATKKETEFGTLTYAGHGESSTVYRLTDEADRTIMIKVGGRGYGPPDTVPIPTDDRHLTLVQRQLGLTKWQYADPRTYVTWTKYGRSLSLQEDGGKLPTNGVRKLLVPYTKQQALRYIDKTLSPTPSDLQNHGTATELDKSRHYLTKPGVIRPLVIDIPVIKRH